MSQDESTQFDFWLGNWELTWGDNGRGTNEITRILDGRIIQENFASAPNEKGQSLIGISVSAYDPNAKQWKQTWVDNQGGYLDFVGGYADDKMILSREAIIQDEPVKQRMVWHNIQAETFDWSWERSIDGGHTWETAWFIRYQRVN